MILRHKKYGSRPIVVHAQGYHEHKPNWRPIKDKLFSEPPRNLGARPNVTVVTCNNGHQAMGVAEASLAHLGVPPKVMGHGAVPWVNSVHKPRFLCQAAQEVDTDYILYLDSRDAMVIDDPEIAVSRFEKLDCDLLFGGDQMDWPPSREYRRYEIGLTRELEVESIFRHMNGGMWIGRTEFCRTFFAEAVETSPLPEAATSEQGILRRLFPKYYPRVGIDYYCDIMINIGFVFGPDLEILDDEA